MNRFNLLTTFLIMILTNTAIASSEYKCFLGLDNNEYELDSVKVGTSDWINCLADKLFRINTEIHAEDRIHIEKYESIVYGLFESDPKNPIYSFLLGRLTAAKEVVYYYENKKVLADRSTYNNDPTILELKSLTKEYYNSSLDNNSSVLKLTAVMLWSISSDYSVQVGTRIKAIRQGLEYSGVPYGGGENYKFNQYGKLVTLYFDKNMFDDALLVLDEMQQEYQNKQNEIEQTRNTILIKKSQYLAQNETDMAVETDERIAVTNQQQSDKAEESKKVDEILLETTDNKAIVIGIVIVILLIVGFLVSRRKKS